MSQAMHQLMDVYGDYATAINLTLELLPWKDVERVLQVLQQARFRQRTIFVVGSGAAAAAAEHLAAVLDHATAAPGLNCPPLQVMPIINAAPLLPIWDNEVDNYSLALRLKGRLHADDVTIAIAANGAPPEIYHALAYARACGGYTIGLLDEDHGDLATLVDLPVIVPIGSVDLIEDVQQILVHIVARTLRKLCVPKPVAAKAGMRPHS